MSNLDRFVRVIALERQDDEQVDVGVLGGRAVGVGAEQDDTFGRERTRDALGHGIDILSVDHLLRLFALFSARLS